MIFARMPTAWRSPTAFTTRKPTGALCSWAPATTRRPLPIGNRDPVVVRDHDFRWDADGRAIPYGIYDTQANRGAVFVGPSHDTPAFAVDAIAQWWLKEGCQRYPVARALFILADGGGSNGPRCRAWRKAIQDTICPSLGLTVTVSHYPPGTSKWNPIEH